VFLRPLPLTGAIDNTAFLLFNFFNNVQIWHVEVAEQEQHPAVARVMEVAPVAVATG